MKIAEIILVLAFFGVLHIATQFKADALDALFNLGNPLTNWKWNLEILTRSIRSIDTWVSNIESQQHRNVYLLGFLRNCKLYIAWNTDGSFCRWISHVSADRGQWGLWIMSLSRFWWGVSGKRREGPFLLVWSRCDLFSPALAVSLFPYCLLVQHHTSDPHLDFPFHSCCAAWAIFHLSSTYSMFLSQFHLCCLTSLPFSLTLASYTCFRISLLSFFQFSTSLWAL